MIPEKFRLYETTCFRQEAHEQDRLWQLVADNSLPETIASWTTNFDLAKEFKGGVPAAGLQGVIFAVKPPVDSIVLNLVELYKDAEFLAFVDKLQSKIDCFYDGIGRWRSTQSEVILDLQTLNSARVYSYGGFSATREQVAELFFERKPTGADLEVFDCLCTQAGVTVGAWWLSQGCSMLCTEIH
jgi:hypothetical protein